MDHSSMQVDVLIGLSVSTLMCITLSAGRCTKGHKTQWQTIYIYIED